MADTVCIYRRRRPKCLSPPPDDEKENDKELNISPTTVESCIAKSSRATKNQPRWIDRSLSSIININKVKADSFSSKQANEKAKKVMSPNVYRKKRVEAPEKFVREQRSYFEQVDAFELEEESPPRVSLETHKVPPNRKLALNAQTEKQLVSEGVVPQSMSRMVQAEVDRKPVFKGLVTPTEPIPIIIINDDENEHPEEEILKSQAFSRSKHLSLQTRQHEVDRAKQKGSYVIIDSPVSLNNKDCKLSSLTPVKCESHQILSPNNKEVPKGNSAAEMSVIRLAVGSPAESRACVQPIQLYCKADEGLVAEIEKLNFQIRKELPNLEALLQKCGQTVPLRLEEAIMQLSTVEDILKLGEGTYGEAFRASNLVFKIVPMGGNFRVNGEVQKTFAEMYTEMLLTLTLNRLRRQSSVEFGSQCNVCNNFVETKMVKVCQGLYGQTLIKAWEEWDIEHESENDHPKVFPENQLYMLFALADGGIDLESFPIASFEEARSILTQVTAALAIAEADCEFEHRDLHWGNILVTRTELTEVHCCRLDGMDMHISTCGVFVHIIDFTLSRLYTGEDVLFSNLSDDPLLFKGPKGDIQAETYRKMLQLTGGLWEKRFSKTNCYWIHYLVDILLTKKKYPCSLQESRALRTLKKRVLHYESARACLQDDFFVIE